MKTHFSLFTIAFILLGMSTFTHAEIESTTHLVCTASEQEPYRTPFMVISMLVTGEDRDEMDEETLSYLTEDGELWSIYFMPADLEPMPILIKRVIQYENMLILVEDLGDTDYTTLVVDRDKKQVLLDVNLDPETYVGERLNTDGPTDAYDCKW